MADDKKWISVGDIPVRDIDMERADEFRRQHPEIDKRQKPFPGGPNTIIESTPT